MVAHVRLARIVLEQLGVYWSLPVLECLVPCAVLGLELHPYGLYRLLFCALREEPHRGQHRNIPGICQMSVVCVCVLR